MAAWETVREAAVREVREEVGLDLDPSALPEVVLRRRASFRFEDTSYEQDEHYFAVAVSEVIVDGAGWTEVERRTISRDEWALSEPDHTDATVFPEELAELVRNFVNRNGGRR